MTVQTLAVIGLVLGATLYFLLVRRRVAERLDGITMSRALAASNQIAMARIRNEPRDRAAALNASEDPPEVEAFVLERRAGTDRRAAYQRGRGRGRRSGGDRRRRGHRH